ncbi:MAG: hypothetical protein R2824_08740 [Saprospiraceae bacterium]|nr:hypothetical protein [Lewinella sp.]
MQSKIHYLLSVIILSAITFSCTKDDFSPNGSDDLSVTEVINTLKSGDWVITYFFDKKDETAHFSGYTFTFEDDGTLKATNGSSTVKGSWSNGKDDSKNKLNINFSSPDNFEDLSEDWHVLEKTDDKIRLEHLSGGNGGTDLLTFEKKG